jgi:hypothetical protein
VKRGNATFSLLLILIILFVFFIRLWHEPKRREVFTRSLEHITITTYGKCRMECMQVNINEVKQVIRKGILIMDRSYRRKYPCTVFILQGMSENNRSIRLVVAQCRDEVEVVNCYIPGDLKECNCPVSENNQTN